MSVQLQNRFDPYHVWLGIHPDEQPSSYYRLLGLAPFEDNPDVIASAADRQMAHLRTFQNGKYSAESQKLLNEVAAAKVKLLRPEAKRAYDAQLRQKLEVKPEVARAQVMPVAVEAPIAAESEEPVFTFVSAAQSDSSDSPRSRKKVKPHPATAIIIQTVTSCTFLAIAGVVGMRMMRPAQTPAPSRSASITSKPPTAPAADGTPSIPGTVPIKSSNTAPISAPSPPLEKIIALTGNVPPTPPAAPRRVSINTRPVSVQPSATPQRPEFIPSERKASRSSKPEPFAPFESESAPVKDAIAPQTKPHETVAERKRLSVPSTAAQKSVQKQLATVFDVKLAKTPLEKLKLASQLSDVAGKADGDSTERYVMLEEALQLAMDGGDAMLALRVVDTLAQQFEYEALEVKEKLLVRFMELTTTSERIRSLVSASQLVIPQAIEHRHYDRAIELANSVARACQRSQGKEFRKNAIQKRDLVQTICKQLKEVQTARETLQSNPADEPANMLLGRWYCFTNEDWQQGLAYLAKGTDKELCLLAQKELNSQPVTAEDQMQLADVWWGLAKQRKGEERDALMVRAGYWYEQVTKTPQAGLVKLKVDQRLEELLEVRERYRLAQAARTLHVEHSTADTLWSDAVR